MSPGFIFSQVSSFYISTVVSCTVSAHCQQLLPEEGDQLKQFYPCSPYCNRGLQHFHGILTSPSPNRKMSPSTIPITQICRGNELHYIKYILQYDHKITKYSELIEELLPTETLALLLLPLYHTSEFMQRDIT